MMAVVCRGPGEIALEDRSAPVAGPDQRVVDVLAAALNPTDLIHMLDAELPSVPGNEGIGILDGRRVYFERTLAPFGSFADRALVDQTLPVPLPEEISAGDALSVGIAGLAGWLSLEWCAQLRAGESVLVLGASGPVGWVAVQAARLLGAGRVVAAARDRSALEPLLEHGADAIVELGGDDAAALRDAANGGFDVVIDPLFGEPLVAALSASAAGARLVSIGASAGPSATITRAALHSRRILTYGNRLTPTAVKRAAYEKMCRLVLAGELEPAGHELVPLERFAEAFERQAAHPHRKLVLVPPASPLHVDR